jgi:signal transduction histidine kinase
MNKNYVLVLACITLLLLVVTPAWADVVAQNDSLLNELRAQNELLQQRSRFTTGGLAMILVVTAMLLFLVINNRWNHRLEIKNRQLERERNVVIAKNKQLAIEYDRAENALKARKAFMQSITHEVRTPLNAISGFTQVLATPDLEMTAAERLDFSLRIQENTRLLTNIVDDLIQISDMESGYELPAPEQFPVAALAAMALEPISSRVAPTVTLINNSTVAEDLVVTTYPQMIQTILRKLLDNSAKFTRQGNITLSVSFKDEKLFFSVTDTGPGIPPEKKDVVFERFSKLDDFVQGTGLGLSLARMAAERIGGTLTLDTDHNPGAKFDLIVPVH